MFWETCSSYFLQMLQYFSPKMIDDSLILVCKTEELEFERYVNFAILGFMS